MFSCFNHCSLSTCCIVGFCFIVIDLIAFGPYYYQSLNLGGGTVISISSEHYKDVEAVPKKTTTIIDEAIMNEWPWNDIDFTTKGKCGYHKCFFDSLSNSNTDSNETGYLVADGISRYKDMKFAYHVAMELATKFGSSHLYLDKYPPAKYNITSGLRRMINDLVDQPSRRTQGMGMLNILESSYASVQRVRKVPSNALFFGDSQMKFSQTMHDLNYGNWSQQVVVSNNTNNGNNNKTASSFLQQFNIERNRLNSIYEYYPNIFADFQCYIGIDGTVYLIDVEGPKIVRMGGKHEASRKALQRIQDRLSLVARKAISTSSSSSIKST